MNSTGNTTARSMRRKGQLMFEPLPNYDNWKTEADAETDFDPYLDAEDEE